MAKFCDKDCEQQGFVCHLCEHYDFNGDADGFYAGEGWCTKFRIHKDPEEGYECSEFVCRRIGKEDSMTLEEEFRAWLSRNLIDIALNDKENDNVDKELEEMVERYSEEEVKEFLEKLGL